MFATLHTSAGDIRVELFPNQAPKTVRNFTGLATGTQTWTDPSTRQKKEDTPFFDGLTFHRVIEQFMIQGGCPLGNGRGGPGYEFDDEVTIDLTFNRPYLLAMANAGKRFGKGTNGSQFFITVVPTPHLNMKHTIFGEVADDASRQVVDKIATTPTGRDDQPLEPITINSVSIEE